MVTGGEGEAAFAHFAGGADTDVDTGPGQGLPQHLGADIAVIDADDAGRVSIFDVGVGAQGPLVRQLLPGAAADGGVATVVTGE